MNTLTHQHSTTAWAILKQHDRYTEENLLDFLSVHYPCIPEDHRLALIHGTVDGARMAANLHVLLEGARTGTDPASHATAQGAQRSISFWKLGLMTRNRNEPQPQALPTPGTLTPISPKHPATAAVPTGAPSQLLELPVSRELSDRKFDRRAQEENETDKLGMPAPAIQLLDDQLAPREAATYHLDAPIRRVFQ